MLDNDLHTSGGLRPRPSHSWRSETSGDSSCRSYTGHVRQRRGTNPDPVRLRALPEPQGLSPRRELGGSPVATSSPLPAQRRMKPRLCSFPGSRSISTSRTTKDETPALLLHRQINSFINYTHVSRYCCKADACKYNP